MGIDVSGSMDGDGCHGEHLITPAVAAAAMAMVALKTEETVYPMAFSNAFVPLAINKEMDLPTVLKTVRKVCIHCFSYVYVILHMFSFFNAIQ